MILKGGPISNWGLGKHLTSEANEKVELIGSRGVFSETITGAITELDSERFMMRAQKNFAHFNMSPTRNLTDEEWSRAWARVEREYGLERCNYVEVQHTKEGRTHRHRVYSRLDNETEKAVTFSHNFRRNERVEHELALELGEPLVPGKHTAAIIKQWEQEGRHDQVAALRAAELGRDGKRKPDVDAARSWAEHQQEQRTGHRLYDLAGVVGNAWTAADSPLTIRSALQDAGLQLARGDRRDAVVVVDQAGGVHGLARLLRRTQPGITAAEIRSRLGTLPRALPGVVQAQEYQRRLRPDIDPPRARSGAASSSAQSAAQSTPEIVADAWRKTRSGAEFRDMLARAGVPIAAGDRRDFVIVDRDGKVRSLARVLKAGGVDATAAEIRTRLADVADTLPSPDDARRAQAQSAQDRDAASGAAAGARSTEMPRRDEAEAARRDRWRQAQQRRRSEERAARDEIHGLAEAQVKAQYTRHRTETAARNKTEGQRSWQQEKDLRSGEWDRLRTSEERERGAIYRSTRRGLIRTLSLAFHKHLSKVAKNRLKSEQAKRWTEAKAETPKVKPMTFREFLQSRAPVDDLARWLLDKRRQREDYQQAQQARANARQTTGRARDTGQAHSQSDRTDRDEGRGR